MKRNRILSALMAGTMVLSLAACGSSASTSTEAAKPAETQAAATTAAPAGDTKKADGMKVGIAMPTKSLERWNRDGSFLQKQFEDKGYKVELTYSDNKIDQQVKDIEGLIADNVNLLVIAAIDGESLSQVLAQAKEANIPVISYDRLIMNTDAISYYVSFDNYTVGKLQGEFVLPQNRSLQHLQPRPALFLYRDFEYLSSAV